MRKLTGIALGLALLCTASTASAVPELTDLYVVRNAYTGDYGVSNCEVKSGYTIVAQSGLYRDSANNMGAGTPCAATPVYECYRIVYVNGYAKYDSFLAKSCASYGGTQTGGVMGYVLNTACETGASPLYLCGFTVYAVGTGGTGAPAWFEYRNASTCTGGTNYGLLGYVQGDIVTNANWNPYGDGFTCPNDCFGACGAGCSDPLGGSQVYTSQCRTHDQCVVDNGCNMYAWACLGDFIAAAVSMVVAKIKNLFKSIVKGIKKLLSKIF